MSNSELNNAQMVAVPAPLLKVVVDIMNTLPYAQVGQIMPMLLNCQPVEQHLADQPKEAGGKR